MNKEDLELKRRLLDAVLAEYERLVEDMRTNGRNMTYVFAAMLAGVVAIVTLFGSLGAMSFALIPMVVSSCGLFILILGIEGFKITEYIREELEGKELKRLFPDGSPIRWESRPKSERENAVFWLFIFLLSLFLCLGCLVSAGLTLWSEIWSNAFYLVFYSFGWAVHAGYIGLTINAFHRIGLFRDLRNGNVRENQIL
jgi:hypothetical protein